MAQLEHLGMSPRYEPSLLRQLKEAMSSSAMVEVLRQDWPYLKRQRSVLQDCEVVRVYPWEGKEFVLEYAIHLLDEKEERVQRVIGRLVGEEADKQCKELVRKLRKRGQLVGEFPSDFVTCLPNMGLVLQFFGLDYRLHGLKSALDPAVMRPILSRCLSHDGDGSAEYSIQILSHRLGKRCVIRYCQESLDPKTAPMAHGSLIGKVYKFRDQRPRQVFAAMQSLWRGGFADSARDGIRIPKPLAYLADLQLLLMEDVAGPSLLECEGNETESAVKAAAKALAKLHRCPLEVPGRHTIEDELELLSDWVALISQMYPEIKAAFEEALTEAQDHLPRHRNFEPALVHRDFHEKQLLLDGSRTALIDFDTLCLSDPAIDVGNFLAHLRLAGLQRLRSVEPLEATFLEAYHPRLSRDFRARVEAYTKSSVLRLACLYSLSPRWRHLAKPLLSSAFSRGAADFNPVDRPAISTSLASENGA